MRLVGGQIWSGAEGDRTPNLCIANTALSQLSYGPGGPAIVAGGGLPVNPVSLTLAE